ncbi:MAG: hypothetical protein HKL90_10455 [Elusimicrobia bacterium]|nr:hypothetical protein [Elusimicrobiota bacterium]
MIRFLSAQDYRIFTVVLDKKAHSERFGKAALHPYHLCLTMLLAYPIKQALVGAAPGSFGERLCLAVEGKQNRKGRTLL